MLFIAKVTPSTFMGLFIMIYYDYSHLMRAMRLRGLDGHLIAGGPEAHAECMGKHFQANTIGDEICHGR